MPESLSSYMTKKIEDTKVKILQVSDSFGISEVTMWSMIDMYPSITYLDIITFIKQHDDIELTQDQGIQLLHSIGELEKCLETYRSLKGMNYVC